MTTQTELDDLKRRLKELQQSKLTERQAEQVRQEIETLEKGTIIKDGGIIGAFVALKAWLIAEKSWLSFKLILLGVSFYYAGAFTHYENYGSYFELGGIVLVIIGLIRLPVARQVWEWIDK